MLRFLRDTALWIILLPYAVGFAGAASNQLVLNANGNTFPVRLNLAKAAEFAGDDAVTLPDGTIMLDETHCLMTSKTHLNWLADIFDFNEDMESVGDLLLNFGGWFQTFCPFVFVAVVCQKLRRP